LFVGVQAEEEMRLREAASASKLATVDEGQEPAGAEKPAEVCSAYISFIMISISMY
jgi:hypothetical protein